MEKYFKEQKQSRQVIFLHETYSQVILYNITDEYSQEVTMRAERWLQRSLLTAANILLDAKKYIVLDQGSKCRRFSDDSRTFDVILRTEYAYKLKLRTHKFYVLADHFSGLKPGSSITRTLDSQ